MNFLASIRDFSQLRLKGLELRVHPSMIGLLIVFLLDHLIYPETVAINFTPAMVYVASLFVHECGHLLAALCLKARPRELVLYPFGSTTAYSGRVTPGSEFFLSGAGIFTSLALAAAFMPFSDLSTLLSLDSQHSFASLVVAINLGFVAVNLLPLSVLDSGRMLRAVLTFWKVSFAQSVIKRVNQATSVFLLISAVVFAHPLLYAAAALVTLVGLKEQVRLQTADAALGLTVGQAFLELKILTCLPHRITISQALPIIVKSFQQYFPVVHSTSLLGLIERDSFIRAASGGLNDDYIINMAKRQITSYLEEDDLGSAIDDMFRKQLDIAAVTDKDGHFKGLFSRAKAVEFLLLSRSVDAPSAPEINDEFMM